MLYRAGIPCTEWGQIKVPVHVPTMRELKHKYELLDSSHRQLGVEEDVRGCGGCCLCAHSAPAQTFVADSLAELYPFSVRFGVALPVIPLCIVLSDPRCFTCTL